MRKKRGGAAQPAHAALLPLPALADDYGGEFYGAIVAAEASGDPGPKVEELDLFHEDPEDAWADLFNCEGGEAKNDVDQVEEDRVEAFLFGPDDDDDEDQSAPAPGAGDGVADVGGHIDFGPDDNAEITDGKPPDGEDLPDVDFFADDLPLWALNGKAALMAHKTGKAAVDAAKFPNMPVAAPSGAAEDDPSCGAAAGPAPTAAHAVEPAAAAAPSAGPAAAAVADAVPTPAVGAAGKKHFFGRFGAADEKTDVPSGCSLRKYGAPRPHWHGTLPRDKTDDLGKHHRVLIFGHYGKNDSLHRSEDEVLTNIRAWLEAWA